MPIFQAPNATVYYDILEPDFTGTTLNTQSSYQAQTVLLLHGFAGTPKSDFAGQLPPLRAHYRVLAPHLHGYGRSSQRSSYALSYYRDDVVDMIALLDALQIEQVLVLGFSDAENVAAIRHWFLEKPLSEAWQAELAELHGEPYWRSLPHMYVEAQEALVAAGGVLISEEELAAIRCPALIMHGKRDRVVPADYSRIIHEHIPGSQLLLFDAGHAAHLRCEKEFTEAVMSFFRGVN